MSPIAWSIIVSIAAIPVTWLWVYLLDRIIGRYRTNDDEEISRAWWMPVAVGFLERAIYTILIGGNVSGAAGFIGAWVTIKAVGGWAKWAGDRSTIYTRAAFSVGLLGSALSAIFGIAAGLIFLAGRH